MMNHKLVIVCIIFWPIFTSCQVSENINSSNGNLVSVNFVRYWNFIPLYPLEKLQGNLQQYDSSSGTYIPIRGYEITPDSIYLVKNGFGSYDFSCGDSSYHYTFVDGYRYKTYCTHNGRRYQEHTLTNKYAISVTETENADSGIFVEEFRDGGSPIGIWKTYKNGELRQIDQYDDSLVFRTFIYQNIYGGKSISRYCAQYISRVPEVLTYNGAQFILLEHKVEPFFQPHGLWIDYDTSGNVKEKRRYHNGKIIGTQ